MKLRANIPQGARLIDPEFANQFKDFYKELTYVPRDRETFDIAAGPTGAKPARVGGGIGRLLRKTVADPFYEGGYQVRRAKAGMLPGPWEGLTTMLGVVGGSAFSPAPRNALGIIQRDQGVAKALRKLMAKESKLRGPAETEPNVVDKLLRGTWYHGGKEYHSWNKEATPYIKGRSGMSQKGGNLGEPVGISLTTSVPVAKGFTHSRKQGFLDALEGNMDTVGNRIWQTGRNLAADADKLTKENAAGIRDGTAYGAGITARIEDTKKNAIKYMAVGKHLIDKAPVVGELPVARVMPRYKGAPKDSIIDAVSPEGGKILKEAYEQTLKDMMPQIEPKMRQHGRTELDYETLEDILFQSNLGQQFNENLTANLAGRGKKGVLYSPTRGGYAHEHGGEQELKMFAPQDVLFLDQRRPDTSYGTSLNRQQATKDALADTWRQRPENTRYNSLSDWYSEIDLSKFTAKPKLSKDLQLNAKITKMFEADPKNQTLKMSFVDVINSPSDYIGKHMGMKVNETVSLEPGVYLGGAKFPDKQVDYFAKVLFAGPDVAGASNYKQVTGLLKDAYWIKPNPNAKPKKLAVNWDADDFAKDDYLEHLNDYTGDFNFGD